jgi:pimeloyl-ACP methyl ester carboxylesterase
LYEEYNIFVPEKFDWGRNNANIFFDIENRKKYTVDNLISNYSSTIKEYLSQNDYETIIIAGFSEGGHIVPELSFQLEKFNISGLISIGAGGLVSPVDIAAARRKEPLDDESIKQYLAIYNQYLNTYGGERYADSPDEIKLRQTGRNRYDLTLMWQYSWYARRPFELYKNIDIPVLFIHGQLDSNVSVVSTRYVEENLPNKPFDFIYYQDMIHYPETIGELKRLRADVANWLREKGL